MEINPHLNTDSFEAAFKAIDTHTVGEFTRIILSGFPPLKGDTMIERKNYLAKHYDKYRTALMFEPRGHHDMFGALLTDPIHPEADFGVIFMDTGEYLNMCGHGTIGLIASLAWLGRIKPGVHLIETPALSLHSSKPGLWRQRNLIQKWYWMLLPD